MGAILQELRFGVRGLRRSPSFALVAVLSLALGIGATTAMFSLIYAVVLDAYPYAGHQRIVNPILRDPTAPTAWIWFELTPAQAAAYKQSPVFEDVFGQGGDSMELRGQELPEDVRVTYLTPNEGNFNRVPALIGRGIQASDNGKQLIVILGHKYWLQRFHGDPGVVGRDLRLDDRTYRVVGVMPQRYTLGGTADMYMPSTQDTRPDERMIYFAKLKPGVTDAQASAAVDPLLHEFAKQEPQFYPRQFHVKLQYLIDPVTKGTGETPGLAHTFPLIFLAVAMLLLIGCANCSILLLARGTARVHEFAVRSAVGASRWRLIRQLLVECLTISFAGAAIGIALSYYLAQMPLKMLPAVFPSESLVKVNLPVLGFSVGAALVSGVLFGLIPAIRFSRPEIAQSMQAGTRTTTGNRGARATLRTLIAGQIALTLVLLAVAGGAIGGFLKLLHLPLGYDPANTVMLGGPYTRGTLKTWPERQAYNEQMKAEIATVPGVLAVAGGDPPMFSWNTNVNVVGQPRTDKTSSHIGMVDPNYFGTLRIPLLRGRVWSEAENRAALPVAVVNQTFVRRYFPAGDPIGHSVEIPVLKEFSKDVPKGVEPPLVAPNLAGGAVQIVGVVGDTINAGMDKPVEPALYLASDAVIFRAFRFLVHTEGDPLRLMQGIHGAVKKVNPGQKLFSDPYTLQRFIDETPLYGQQRLIALLFGIFAAAALALALVGLYSVVAFAVSQRTGEFGVRMALGAQRSSILQLVLRSTLPTLVGGTAVGLVLAMALRSATLRWSEGNAQSSAFLFAAALLMVAAGVLASVPPARRAARIEPMRALRSE